MDRGEPATIPEIIAMVRFRWSSRGFAAWARTTPDARRHAARLMDLCRWPGRRRFSPDRTSDERAAATRCVGGSHSSKGASTAGRGNNGRAIERTAGYARKAIGSGRAQVCRIGYDKLPRCPQCGTTFGKVRRLRFLR